MIPCSTIGGRDACVHREALALDHAGRHAPTQDLVEEAAEDLALVEALVPVLGERGVVGLRVLQPQAVEPAVGKVQV
jgi:hypothetical protein